MCPRAMVLMNIRKHHQKMIYHIGPLNMSYGWRTAFLSLPKWRKCYSQRHIARRSSRKRTIEQGARVRAWSGALWQECCNLGVLLFQLRVPSIFVGG